MLWLHGCASVDTSESKAATSPELKKAVPSVEQRPAPTVRMQKPKPVEAIESPLPSVRRLDPNVVIVLSNDTPAFLQIARQVNGLLAEPARIYTLADDALLDKATIAQIEISSSKQLIAVGLAAARALRTLRDRQVVFCGVVNYHDYDLVSENMKGVGATPSPDKLFADWKRLSPQLNRVLVVSGPGFEDYIVGAQRIAQQQRIRLTHRVVDSESEFIDAVQQQAGTHQGQWILADSRVLNSAIVRRVIAINTQQGVQSVVFSPESLAWGGLFYVAPSALEVSRKVIDRFQQSRSSKRIAGEGVLVLDDHEMGINASVAKRFGIRIPTDWQGFIRYD